VLISQGPYLLVFNSYPVELCYGFFRFAFEDVLEVEILNVLGANKFCDLLLRVNSLEHRLLVAHLLEVALQLMHLFWSKSSFDFEFILAVFVLVP